MHQVHAYLFDVLLNTLITAILMVARMGMAARILLEILRACLHLDTKVWQGKRVNFVIRHCW